MSFDSGWVADLISQKVFIKLFCKSRFPHKSVNLLLVLVTITPNFRANPLKPREQEAEAAGQDPFWGGGWSGKFDGQSQTGQTAPSGSDESVTSHGSHDHGGDHGSRHATSLRGGHHGSHQAGLNPQPSTLNPKPQTLNPKPQTLNPKP